MVLFFFSSRRRHTRCALVTGFRRVLFRSLRGVHGLPLIGGGDWNDGMNRVGEAGRGESVWLGFFSCEVLTRFAEVARLRDDEAFAHRCDAEVARLRIALEQHGWDGAWYRRAWFDDGTPQIGRAHV